MKVQTSKESLLLRIAQCRAAQNPGRPFLSWAQRARKQSVFSPLEKTIPPELKTVIECPAERTSLPQKIGNWIPEKLKSLIIQHYDLIANVPITTGYLGDEPIDAGTSVFLNQHKFGKVKDIMVLHKYGIQRLEKYREIYLNHIVHALTAIVDRINTTDQIPAPPRIGNWVPEDLHELIGMHYEIIAELPTSAGHLGNVALGTRVTNVFENHGFSKTSDFINLPEKYLLSLKNFGKTSIRAVANALRITAKEIENESFYAAPTLSAKIIHEALSALPPHLKIAVEMRFGFTTQGKTLNEIGEAFEVTREGARIKIIKALNKLKLPRLKGMRQLIIDTATEFLKDKIAINLEELKETFKQRGLLKEEDEPYLMPIIYLLDNIFGQHFTYIHAGNGEIAPNVTKKDIWLVQDHRQFQNVLPSFGEMEKDAEEPTQPLWKFTEYQKMLQEKYNILVSVQELRKIFEAHEAIIVENDIFYGKNRRGLIRYRVKEIIKKHGPLHAEKIAKLAGYPFAKIILILDDEFVRVANSIYDLAENHPELKDVPFPKTKRRSAIFAAIYGVLRDHEDGLEIHELHEKMKAKGHKWSKGGLNWILNMDEKHKHFFVQIGKGTYALAEYYPELKNIPYPNVKHKAPAFAAVYGILRNAETKLSPSEIHQRMLERDYKWTYSSVRRILRHDKNYRDLFVKENGKFGLKTQED